MASRDVLELRASGAKCEECGNMKKLLKIAVIAIVALVLANIASERWANRA